MAKKSPLPPIPVDDPDLAIDCELHLEPAFNKFAEQAMAEGWSEADVDAALVSLARHRIMARIERERTGRQIARARRQ